MRRILPLLSALVLVFAATAPAAEVDKYLLDDTDGVVGVNVKMLLDSQLFKKNYLPVVQKHLQGNADLQKNLKEVGFDPLKDVDRILLVHGDSCHRTEGSKSEFSPFIIVRGRFDPAKFHAKAAQFVQFAPKTFKTHKLPHATFYEIVGEKSLFIGMPDKNTVVGSLFKEPVSLAMDKGANKKKTDLKNFGMQFLIEQVDFKNTIWVAALGRMAPAEDTPLPTAKGKKVEKMARKKLSDSGIRELSGGIAIKDGITGAFRIKVEDPETAKTISEVLTQFLPEAAQKGFDGQLEGKQFSPLREFLKNLVIGSEDNDLLLKGEVSGKVFVESLK